MKNKITKLQIVFALALLVIMPLGVFPIAKEARAEGGCYEYFGGTITNNRTGQVVQVGPSGDNVVVQIGDVLAFDVYIDTLGSGGLYDAVANASGGIFSQPTIGSYLGPSTVGFRVTSARGDLRTNFTISDTPGAIELTAECEDPNVYPDGQPHTMNVHYILEFDDSGADFALSCTPASTTITTGSSTSFNLSTSPIGAYNGVVTFAPAGISPSSGTRPTISYTNNNGNTPPFSTVANVTTTASTTPGIYALTFTASDGTISHSCQTQLIVNPIPGGFNLTISPNPVDALKGDEVNYTVTSTCTGSFSGPINLSADSLFTGLTYLFKRNSTVITSMNCNESVTLVVGNTGAIPSDELSTPAARLGKTLTVTGLPD